MKKSFMTLFLLLFTAFSLVSFSAKPIYADGNIGTGGRMCTPDPCPPPDPPNSDGNRQSGDSSYADSAGQPEEEDEAFDWLTFWLSYYLFR